MASFAKANATMRDLADKLSKRLLAGAAGLNTIRQTIDSNGWPMLFLSHGGTETESNPVIAIRIKGVDMVSKDIFGNALVAYTPHTVELAYELSATTNKTDVATADVMTVAYEVIKLGMRYQVKEIANGTAVTATAMDAATAAVDVEELYWPTKSM